MTERAMHLRGGISSGRRSAPRNVGLLGRRPRRFRQSAVSTLVLMLAASVLTTVGGSTPAAALAAPSGFTANGHPNAAHLSGCSAQGAGTLCVQAAEDSLLPGPGKGGQGPSKNDPVPQYKWLLNKDNTGGVTLGADGRTPVPSEVTKCHPITSTFSNGNANYPNAIDGSGPILSDGSPNPAACNWPSIHNITSSPVVSEGTQADWGPGAAIPLFKAATGRGLADGKYLVSITSNGYQIGGGHFVVAGGKFSGLDATTGGAVVVSLNPLPIPLTNIRLKVYGDMASTNAQWDEQSEFGLPGFNAHLTDFDGPVNVDYYNNPLCTAYQLSPAYDGVNHPNPTDTFYQVKLGLAGRPIIDAQHHVRGNFEVAGPATGQCTSDSNGDILIPNMAPNRYGSSVIADQNGGLDPVTNKVIPAQPTCPVLDTKSDAKTTAVQSSACWVQTTTLEGNHDFDTWPQANSTGYDTELLVGGELVPQVQFGFVRAGCMANQVTGTVDYTGLTGTNWLSPSDPACAKVSQAPTTAGGIKGKILGAAAYYPGLGGLAGTGGNAGTAGYKFDRPVKHPWVTLSDLNNGDKTIWASNANLDGTFQINGVPDGSYSIAVWDQMQDYIFDSFNVTVAGGKMVDLGVVPLLEWWTRITGHICVDTNGNGRCDPGEAGVPHFVVQNLNRTNNAQEGGQNTAETDQNGYYEFTEAYPLGYADVIQAFNTRFKTTGLTWQACNDPQEHTTLTAAVDVQYNPVIAQCGRLDWAVQPYSGATTTAADPNKLVNRADNGGIVATVLYDAVRNRNLGRSQVAYDYFTGIPGVLTELFQPIKSTSADKATQTCGTATDAPNVSFNHYLLNCDGSYKTNSPTHGYSTSYANGAVKTTDRFGGADPAKTNPGTVSAYQSEHYARATGCVARDGNGKVISGSLGTNGKVVGTNADGTTVTDFLPGLTVDPASPNPGHYTQACIEAPASAVNFGLGTDNLPLDPNVPGGDTHGSQTVDGNFGLTPTDAAGNPATGDFLAKVDIPGDKVLPQPTPGVDRPLYKIADEASANNFAGAGLAPNTPDVGTIHASTPQFVPQNADLNTVYNQDGSAIDLSMQKSCPVLATGLTGQCVAFSFPSQAGPPSQTPIAAPVTGGDSPTSQIEDPNTASPSPDVQCAGSQFTVHVTDPGLQSVGGSPQEGNVRNSCDVHLVHVGGGQSVAPNFYLYTDVPVPTTFIVQNFDDTNLSTTKTETQFGDAAPIPNSPEGVYDWHGNLVDQMNIDPNGIAEALMPSTDVANCATPAGICQNIYRFVGNDPGTIDHPNFNYNPQFQTITANFQAMPGVFTPADTAPTRSALAFLNGGQKFTAAAQCAIAPTAPQLYSVDRPYTDFVAHAATVVIKGLGFGGTQGKGNVTLSGSSLALPAIAGITSWSDSEIHATIPAGTPGGKYQLAVSNDALTKTVNGISYYVIAGTYKPTILEVDPTFTTEATNLDGWKAQTQFPSIQEAVERAAGYWLQPTSGNLVYTQEPNTQLLPGAIVVVYPAATTQQSPANSAVNSGVWFEPVILHSAVTLQGVGPGGVIPATAATAATNVPGTVIDGRYYFSLTDNAVSPPAAIDWATAPQDVRAQHGVDVWQTIAGALFPKTPGADNKLITEGQNVTVLGQNDQPEYSSAAHPVVDGFGLQAAVTINTPTNVNANTGQRTGPAGGADATQGGALFLNGHDDWTQVTNNVIDGNSGSYGAIRVGSPQLDNQHNWNVEFGNNQIVANGGNNLGGGMAIFNDAGGYNIHDNLLCGNQSAEYGGGMSQYGLSVAPLNLTGTLAISAGNRPTATFTATTAPFVAGDSGKPVTGFGLRGARISTVTSKSTVTLSTTLGGTAGTGMLSYQTTTVPSGILPSNMIAHNVISLNQSQDEGGGIMIAGQLPQDSTKASQGAGPVTISGNTIAVNAANDDGGGLRFLQAGNSPMRVENNIITNNVSSHEGGGISLDDTSQVTVINNTIAKNLTTATAVTSNGTAAPAGVSTAANSTPFQNSLPRRAPKFSNPILANNIIYDNRAGSWNASTSNVAGIGQTGDRTPINVWDIGTADTPGLLSPTNSLLSTAFNAGGGEGYNNSTTNKLVTPSAALDPTIFATPFDLQLDIAPMRINFRFRVTAIVNIGLPANGIGNYRITNPPPPSVSSPAGIGALSVKAAVPFPNTVFAPLGDIDGTTRPAGLIDAGAAQVHR